MRLLAELARVLRLVDSMPPRVIADAEAAGVLLRPEPLVPLLDTVAAVRSSGRRLRLGCPGGDAVLEVEIHPVGPALRVAGLAPPGAGLEIHWPDGGAEASVDAAGYFNVEVPDGPIRLVLAVPGRRVRATDWI
jgi:hypothetical protein